MLAIIELGDTLPPDHPWSPGVAGAASDPNADLGMVERLRERHVASLRRRPHRKPSALMRAIKAFDEATYRHCVRVSALAVAVGLRVGLGSRDLRSLERAALVHDAGKLCVPESILNKAGELSPEEWEFIKQHPVAGEAIGFEATGDPAIAKLIRHHHERLDGSGYPDRLSDADIPVTVRVLQAADIYDALTTERSYKRAFPKATALAMLQEEAERGWRDPAVVGALVSSLA